MTRPGWSPPSPEREIGRGDWRDSQLERRLVIPNAPLDIMLGDDNTPVQAGDGPVSFPVDDDLHGRRLLAADAGVSIPGATITRIQIRNRTQAVDMLSQRIEIFGGDETSFVGTPGVPDPANNQVFRGDRIRIDVDNAGSGATGLCVMLMFGD